MKYVCLLLTIMISSTAVFSQQADKEAVAKMFESNTGTDVEWYTSFASEAHEYFIQNDTLLVIQRKWYQGKKSKDVFFHIPLAQLAPGSATITPSFKKLKGTENDVTMLELRTYGDVMRVQDFPVAYNYAWDLKSNVAELPFASPEQAKAALAYLRTVEWKKPPAITGKDEQSRMREFCMGIQRYLEDMVNHNFEGYVGPVVRKDPTRREGFDFSDYSSLKPFPGEGTTLMREGNRVQNTREATVVYLKEAVIDNKVSSTMEAAFKKLSGEVMTCMKMTTFTEKIESVSHYQPMIKKFTKHLDRQVDKNDPFALGRMGGASSNATIQVVVTQLKIEDGTIQQALTLEFKME